MSQLSKIQLINLKLAQDYVSDIYNSTDDSEIKNLSSVIDSLICELMDYNSKLEKEK